MRVTGAPTTPQQERANQLKSEYRAHLESIRGDKKLSPQGKQQRLAQVYLQYKPEIERLQEQQEATQQNRRSTLRRELFGLAGTADPNAAISYRDAQDRASKIKDEREAQQLLNRAELSGDTTLAKAIAAEAFEQGWNGPINQYAGMFPNSGPKFNELVSLERSNQAGSSAGLAQMLGEAMTYHVDRPHELSAYPQDSSLQRIAEG